MGRRFLGLNKMKQCYVCSSTAPAELPGQERCCFTQCWGPELYLAVLQAAQTPELDQTEEQRKLLVDSAEGTYVREQHRKCPKGLDGKRFFHQTCLKTPTSHRHQSLSHDNKLFAAPSRKAGGAEEATSASGTKSLRDLRHHLCEDCLLQVSGSLDVKSPPVRSLRDEEKHKQRRSDKAASISIKRHKAKLEALEAKGVISVTFHQSRAKRWQTSTSECVKQMAQDQPEFAQQFEAAAAHLMKLISDADWRQEQLKRQPPAIAAASPPAAVGAADQQAVAAIPPLPPAMQPAAVESFSAALAQDSQLPQPQPSLPDASRREASPVPQAPEQQQPPGGGEAQQAGRAPKRSPDVLSDQDAMAACVTLYNVQQNKRVKAAQQAHQAAQQQAAHVPAPA